MKAGRLDKYITIQQPTFTISNDTNDKYPSAWTTYKSCYASRVHKQSQEVFETGQMVAKDTFEWGIRYYDAPAIKMDMRISYNSEYYYLVGIREYEKDNRKDAWIVTTVKRDN